MKDAVAKVRPSKPDAIAVLIDVIAFELLFY